MQGISVQVKEGCRLELDLESDGGSPVVVRSLIVVARRQRGFGKD